MRRFVQFAEYGLAALHAEVECQRQAHGDGQHDEYQQGGQRLFEQLADGVFGRFEVEGEVVHEANLPSCRRKMRWP